VPSRVLKAGSERTAKVTSLYDARLEAERILAEARAEAQRIVAEAESEAERARAQAVQEGRERGLAAVSELLVGARAVAARARQSAEADLRALAVKIAEKILGRELELQPNAVVDVAREAIRLIGEPHTVTLRAHPDDVEALERGRPRLLERLRTSAALTIRADERIGRGGCIVESELGLVDARLSTQLEAIERALRGEAP
jgi:type III secretion protein L